MVIDDGVREAARLLAEANAESDPNIQEIYLFPAPDQIRLIEIDPTSVPNDRIRPYYFGADPAGGVPFPMAIALIRPGEKHLPPPDGWGSWTDAQLVWPRR